MTQLSVSLRAATLLGFVLFAAGCAGTDEGGDAGDAQARAGSRTAYAEITPQQLLGLDADQLTSVLGPADFRRNDGPAEIWQFRNDGCVLDVFLYSDASTGSYRVEHVNARERVSDPSAGQTCIAGLLRQRRARAAG